MVARVKQVRKGYRRGIHIINVRGIYVVRDLGHDLFINRFVIYL